MGRRNLKLERIKAGYNLKDFADKINTSKATVSNLENAKRVGSYQTWLNIQRVLNKKNDEMWDLYLIQEDKWNGK